MRPVRGACMCGRRRAHCDMCGVCRPGVDEKIEKDRINDRSSTIFV